MHTDFNWVKDKIEGFNFLKKHEKSKIFKKYVEEIHEISSLEKKEFVFNFDCNKINASQRPRMSGTRMYAPDGKIKNSITKNFKDILETNYTGFEIPKYYKIRVEITANFRLIPKNKFERVLMYLGFLNVFKKPDVDNIAKIHLDACNGLLWEDDAHVTELLVIKRYNLENPDQDNMNIKVIYN